MNGIESTRTRARLPPPCADPSDPRNQIDFETADDEQPIGRFKFTVGGDEAGAAGAKEALLHQDSPRMLRRKTLSERIRSASSADRELSFTTDRNSEWRADRKSAGQPEPKPAKRNSLVRGCVWVIHLRARTLFTPRLPWVRSTRIRYSNETSSLCGTRTETSAAEYY